MKRNHKTNLYEKQELREGISENPRASAAEKVAASDQQRTTDNQYPALRSANRRTQGMAQEALSLIGTQQTTDTSLYL